MLVFKKVVPGISMLESPFGDSWSGITLVQGGQNILIDSGANAEIVDTCLIPALHSEGMELSDITWLLNTHCHGDHIGGHYRIKELADVKVATYRGSLDKMRDPLKYNKLIRARFPDYSPPPASELRGVEPDLLLDDGELIAGRLCLIPAPGHDDDTVCWYDEETKTLISGDSLQSNGTMSQGIGFYQDLAAYRSTLLRLSEMKIDNIIAGHPFIPCGEIAKGPEKARAYLEKCHDLIVLYDKLVNDAWNAGEHDPVAITRQMIKSIGGQIPDYLFLALYTVTEHLGARC